MKFVEKNNRKYRVIPEARKVICETQSYNIDNEWKHVNKATRALLCDANSYIKGLHNGMFEAYQTTAYCDERDEFDEKKGMDIASEKADLYRHESYIKYYERMIELLNEAAFVCNDLLIKHETKAQNIQDDMVRFYGWSRGDK